VFGVHAVVVWQWLQSKWFTGNVMCPLVIPVAVVPSWHEAQLPVMPVWLNAAGCPRKRRVARVAFLRRGDVRRRLAGGGDSVVAARAASRHVSVIHSHDGLPRRRRVAVVATGVAGDVTAVSWPVAIVPLWQEKHAPDDLRVIHSCRRFPGAGAMALLAAARAGNVRGILAVAVVPL
jgi:hypothetical protein